MRDRWIQKTFWWIPVDLSFWCPRAIEAKQIGIVWWCFPCTVKLHVCMHLECQCRGTCCACIVPVKVTLVRWRSENTVSVMKSRPNIKICLFLSACVVERSAWAHATSFALCTFVLTVSIYWSVLCFLDLLSKYHECTIEPFTLCWPIRKIIDIHRPIMIHISWIAAVRLSSDIQWLHWWSALPNSPRNVQKGKSFKRGRLGGSSCVRHVFVFFWCTASGFVCDL